MAHACLDSTFPLIPYFLYYSCFLCFNHTNLLILVVNHVGSYLMPFALMIYLPDMIYPIVPVWPTPSPSTDLCSDVYKVASSIIKHLYFFLNPYPASFFSIKIIYWIMFIYILLFCSNYIFTSVRAEP